MFRSYETDGIERRGIGLRDVGAVLAGVAIGVLAAKLLPPIIGQASGWTRARFGADPFEHLLEEHRRITWLLGEMERSNDASRGRKMKLLLALKHVLAAHVMAEEDAVYPALLGAQDRDVVRHFYEEHGEVKMHLYDLEQAVKFGVDWRDKLRVMRTLLLNHIRDEEDVQFPRLREVLSGKSGRRLAGVIRREEAMIR